MAYRSMETNYLISLLSSVMNKRMPSSPVRAIEWRSLFYLAEYHDITNFIYYALIGVSDGVPDIWKERFSKIFRKWVSANGEQVKEVASLLDGLDAYNIDYMVLEDWLMKDYYPQPDMRAVEDIMILVKPGNEKKIKTLMRELGYHREMSEETEVFSFFKTIRCRILFYTELFSRNRKLRPYFSKIWQHAQLIPGCQCRYSLNIDDFYIYLQSAICDAYANSEVDVRDIIDIHLYLRKYREDLNWPYIETTLTKLELINMARCLEAVGDLWFGVYEGDGVRECRDVEEYIWSKGDYGRKTSETLLPLMLDMEIWKIKDARKERICKFIRWWFPKTDYIQGLYPKVEKNQYLLPFFWILRLLHLASTSIWMRFIRIRRTLSLKLNQKLEKRRKEKAEEKKIKRIRRAEKMEKQEEQEEP